jgi:metal-responsive CopG/Arc/MetJ family transcriptional regulator
MKVPNRHSDSVDSALAKVRISISIPKEALDWIDSMVEKRIYANRSHAIEVLVIERMRRGKGEDLRQ